MWSRGTGWSSRWSTCGLEGGKRRNLRGDFRGVPKERKREEEKEKGSSWSWAGGQAVDSERIHRGDPTRKNNNNNNNNGTERFFRCDEEIPIIFFFPPARFCSISRRSTRWLSRPSELLIYYCVWEKVKNPSRRNPVSFPLFPSITPPNDRNARSHTLDDDNDDYPQGDHDIPPQFFPVA
jgi:hypothetical protein